MTNSLGFPINSFGYAGTIGPNDVWAAAQAILGARYTVAGAGDARVTPVSGGTRQVTVAAGSIGGYGVLDQITSDVTVQLPTVASGTEWFLIVARRTWGVTQATSLTYIDAGTTPSLPTRNTSPGTIDDQPLALVPLTAGFTAPGAPIDLRIIGTAKSGPAIAFDPLALSYYDEPGAQVRINTDVWTRAVSAGYIASWVKDPGPFGTVAGLASAANTDLFTPAPGWAIGNYCRGERDGNTVAVTVRAVRTGAAIMANSAGNFADTAIGTLAAGWRPRFTRLATVTYTGSTATALNAAGLSFAGGGYVLNNGSMVIASGAPSQNIAPRNDGATSVEIDAVFIVDAS